MNASFIKRIFISAVTALALVILPFDTTAAEQFNGHRGGNGPTRTERPQNGKRPQAGKHKPGNRNPRPGNAGNHNRPDRPGNAGHHNNRPRPPRPSRPTPPDRPHRPSRPQQPPHHRPERPHRPPHLGGIYHHHYYHPVPPPPRPYRPHPRPIPRPVVPYAYVPAYNAPILSAILGLTFGISLASSLSALQNGGYSIDGYDVSEIYLRNVRNLDYLWDDAILYYDDADCLDNVRFYYSTAHDDASRFHSLYTVLCSQYGSPAVQGSSDYTWFDRNGEHFISLGYSYAQSSGGSYRFYTTLSYGE